MFFGWPVVRPASWMKHMGSFLWEGLSLNQGNFGVKASGGAWGAAVEGVVGPSWRRQTLVTGPPLPPAEHSRPRLGPLPVISGPDLCAVQGWVDRGLNRVWLCECGLSHVHGSEHQLPILQ